MSPDCDPLKVLTTEADICGWNAQGLPSDPVSSENGTIVCNSSRWPLLIDPQLQGVSWIKTREGGVERNLQITRLGAPDMLQKLESSIENGWSLLIENMGEKIDAVLTPVISRAVIKRGQRYILKLGENEVEYNKDFRLFLHTKLSNPHYPPEIQAECTLVNFTVTLKGLEDQLLSLVVRKERPDLASQKAGLVQQSNQFKVQLAALEDDILIKLSAAEGDVTEDRELIEGLEEAKRVSNEVNEKLEEGAKTNEKIEETSEAFRSVASRGSLLFFLMNGLHKMHTYYMYSLNAFVVIFQKGIQVAQEKLSNSGGGGGRKTMMRGLGRLKSLAKTVIKAERFNWNADMLESARMPSGDDLAGLIGGLLGASKESAELSQMTPEIIESRCRTLKSAITETLFDYLRRGLFEKDKLTVAAMLAFKIQAAEGVIKQEIVDAMVNNKQANDQVPMTEEIAAFLPETLWNRLKGLEEALAVGEEKVVPFFEEISDKVAADSEDWGEWYNSSAPETLAMPGEFAETLSTVEKLLIIRALRPDRVPFALTTYLTESLGANYVNQPPFDMTTTYQESSASTPIFFVLFPGVDPTPWVEALARSFDISAEKGTFANISLGQGQEGPAENMLEKMAASGGWVMLQNLHLMQNWLPILDRKLEVCAETAHHDFRCFISAEPPPLPYMKNMPEALLQACIKVSNEAPSDLKSNLTRAWGAFNQERLDACSKAKEFRSCLFGLCLFHSLMLGRKKFGSQGWSRGYSFNTGDLTICADILQNYLNQGDGKTPVPFQDLRYLFGEIMYGGHITDFWDRRTCSTYLDVVFTEGLLQQGALAPKFVSPDPVGMTYSSYADYIDRALPTESPVLFGLHSNAEIGYLTNNTEALFGTILKLSVGSLAGGEGGGANALRDTVDDLTGKCPHKFDLLSIAERAKPLLTESHGPFVTVTTQECTRMNVLLLAISNSLADLKKGMNGQLNMTMQLEDLAEALTINQVPGRNPFHSMSWEKDAWESKKSLGSWFLDLQMRNTELRTWSESLILPFTLWLPGLFNPTAFLTAIKQVTARAKGLPLDKMSIETHVTKMMRVDEVRGLGKYPEDGAFVHGLFIEGARWLSGEDADNYQYNISGVDCEGMLAESKLKELIPMMPVMYCKAVVNQDDWTPVAVGYLRPELDIYNCPVYLTSARGGTFCTLATLKTESKKSPSWVLAGVCLLMQSDD
jgi:dynein heavy chain